MKNSNVECNRVVVRDVLICLALPIVTCNVLLFAHVGLKRLLRGKDRHDQPRSIDFLFRRKLDIQLVRFFAY